MPGGRRAGAGRPIGSGWRPKVSELREGAIEQMRAIVGSDRDPLMFICELAADTERDMQLRLSAASIALPYLYPRLSQTQVQASHTVTRIDHSEIVQRLVDQLAKLAPPATIEAQAEPVAAVGGAQ